MAASYMDRGNHKSALSKLQVCYKKAPDDIEALDLLADCFVGLGQNDKSVAVLKELAKVCHRIGEKEVRNQTLERILKIAPDDALARQALEKYQNEDTKAEEAERKRQNTISNISAGG